MDGITETQELLVPPEADVEQFSIIGRQQLPFFHQRKDVLCFAFRLVLLLDFHALQCFEEQTPADEFSLERIGFGVFVVGDDVPGQKEIRIDILESQLGPLFE